MRRPSRPSRRRAASSLSAWRRRRARRASSDSSQSSFLPCTKPRGQYLWASSEAAAMELRKRKGMPCGGGGGGGFSSLLRLLLLLARFWDGGKEEGDIFDCSPVLSA